MFRKRRTAVTTTASMAGIRLVRMIRETIPARITMQKQFRPNSIFGIVDDTALVSDKEVGFMIDLALYSQTESVCHSVAKADGV